MTRRRWTTVAAAVVAVAAVAGLVWVYQRVSAIQSARNQRAHATVIYRLPQAVLSCYQPKPSNTHPYYLCRIINQRSNTP